MTDDLRPSQPKRSKKAARWSDYYTAMARWFGEMAHSLNDYPGSKRYAEDEAKRYQEGADQIASGTHPNQASGAWK